MHQPFARTFKRGVLPLAIFVLIIHVGPALSQSVWVNTDTTEGIAVEWLKFSNEERFRQQSDHPSALSSSMFISGKLQLEPGFMLVGELPLSHWQYIDPDGPDAQAPHTTIGNIYIGMEWHISSSSQNGAHKYLEFGLRFPSMPEPDFPDRRGAFSGYMTAVERTDAFDTEYLPLHLYYNHRESLTPHLDLRLRGGLAYFWYRSETHGGDINLDRGYVHYGTAFYFTSEYFNASAGLLGQYWILNQKVDDYHVPARYEVATHVQYVGATFNPGLFLKVPINATLTADAIYGITAEIPLTYRSK